MPGRVDQGSKKGVPKGEPAMISILQTLPFDIIEKILEKLHSRDLAALARASRKANALVTPLLYRTVHFRLPGFISRSINGDALIRRLETFSEEEFINCRHTRRVIVSGTWYHEYDDLDSQLGHENLLSPAVRMLNALLAVCLTKMPLLKDFIWDAQVAPTQSLISRLPMQPALEFMQLRLGTNSTPKPYFRPTLSFSNYTTLKTLRLVQVDKANALESIGNVLSSAQQLQHLTVWADYDAELSMGTLFNAFGQGDVLSLRTLDLRGFVTFGLPLPSLWTAFNPKSLLDLTLDLGNSHDHDDFGAFWTSAALALVRPKRLATNRISTALVDYIRSFVGLEELRLIPCSINRPSQPLTAFLEATVNKHASSLQILAVSPRGDGDHEYLMTRVILADLTESCTRLREFSFGLAPDGGVDGAQIDLTLQLPRLRVLHITVDCVDDGDHADYIEKLRVQIVGFLERRECRYLQYVAFGDGPLWEIGESPSVWLKLTDYVGRITDTVLFRQPEFDWLDEVG